MNVAADLRIRNIRGSDAGALATIEGSHTGDPRPDWWVDVVSRHTRPGHASVRVGLVAEDHDTGLVVGYVLGQVRAFEFGSEPCGWIFSVGVRKSERRRGIATRLLAEARARFHEAGVRLVRTMVRRDDVPMLTLLRSNGFEGGPYVELESTSDVPPGGERS